jgi:hypothetical protein
VFLQQDPASFRDPAGYVVHADGVYKRVITEHGRADYDRLMESGLYEALSQKGLLIPHTEEILSEHVDPAIYKLLSPEQLEFVSYPYEWSFAQLKDAALLTLRVQQEALNHGMSLKDASFFNVQFQRCRPVFIDTSSFEQHVPRPWPAYRQFCRHFLAPLLLMAYRSPQFNRYLRADLDGFDLDLAWRLLPWAARLRPGVLMHLGLHAWSEKRHAGGGAAHSAQNTTMTLSRQQGVIDSLKATIHGINLPRSKSEWSHYYDEAKHYPEEAEKSKHEEVAETIRTLQPGLVFDLGGNIGNYSRTVTQAGIRCVCFDQDPLCVDANYRRSRDGQNPAMLPLVMDLANPTPGLGFADEERMGWQDRPEADLLLALALLHHLRITANVPLRRLAEFFASLGKYMLVEFIPKDDPLVQRLMAGREDTFHDYDEAGFASAFEARFKVLRKHSIPGTSRTLYLLERC